MMAGCVAKLSPAPRSSLLKSIRTVELGEEPRGESSPPSLAADGRSRLIVLSVMVAARATLASHLEGAGAGRRVAQGLFRAATVTQ